MGPALLRSPASMSSEATPDAALLAAAQRGDSEALTGLIVRYSPRILRFGMKMCRHEDDAREVLQDTLLTAARSVRDFRGQSSLSTWLYTIARSFCVKRRRRNVGEPANLEPIHELKAELTPELVDLRNPEGEAASREVAAVLEEAILELDPIYREVLLLRDVEGLSAIEVAQVVGASVDAVKSRLHRARALVRLRLAPLLRTESEARSAGEACPDVVELLSRHLEHEIGSEVCREMEGHVAGCAHCASRCDSLRKVLALCEAAPLPRLAPELTELEHPERQLVVYCRSGARSGAATKLLKAAGFGRVHDMGAMSKWRD